MSVISSLTRNFTSNYRFSFAQNILRSPLSRNFFFHPHVDRVRFKEALERVKTMKKNPENETKLKMYGLYKQATEGACNTPKPTVFDINALAKWEAWNSCRNISNDDAKGKYADLIDEILGKPETAGGPKNPEIKYTGIQVTVNENITEIKFNLPQKRNAINIKMYREIITALKEATENNTVMTILTGAGDYFSSGNDLSNFQSIDTDIEVAAKNAGKLLNDFVKAFIDFPKILVAAVNGPAYGIPVTLLGLCDVVYASDKATFQTPFSFLGQSPEACATYTFPKIMGYSKANEILLFNKKFDASEAKSLNLVSEVFPHATFQQDLKKQLEFLSSASKQSMILSKQLIRNREKEVLHKVNNEECARLVERWQSRDCMEALLRFFQRKSKL